MVSRTIWLKLNLLSFGVLFDVRNYIDPSMSTNDYIAPVIKIAANNASRYHLQAEGLLQFRGP